MADNIRLNQGAGGDLLAAQDRGPTDGKFQRVLIELDDSGSVDAFGRLRTAEPLTIFDSKQIFDNQPLFWDESLESGAGITSAHSVDTASTVFTSTLNTAGKFTRQTFMRFNYQPGKSQQIMLTGILDRSGGGTGVQRRIGYFDDNNGVFFEDDEGTIKVVRRTSVTGSAVDNKVAQVSWNIDIMDGTGRSGVTLDFTKVQLFLVDFQWLSAGRVRICVIVAGRILGVHQFLTANVLDKPWASTPNLPLRYQMVTTGASPVSTMEAICASVASEGGVVDLGITRYQSTAGTHLNADDDDTLYTLLAFRLKTTHLGLSVTLIEANVAEHQGNNTFEWCLIFNPTIAGAALSYTNVVASGVQFAKGVTENTITGGELVAGGQAASAQKGSGVARTLNTARRLGAAIDGTRDVLVLAVRPNGGSMNLDVEGGLTWQEYN